MTQTLTLTVRPALDDRLLHWDLSLTVEADGEGSITGAHSTQHVAAPTDTPLFSRTPTVHW